MRQQFIWNPRLSKSQKERKSVIESHSGPDLYGTTHISGTNKGRETMLAARKIKGRKSKAGFGARMAQLRAMKKRAAVNTATKSEKTAGARRRRGAKVARIAASLKKNRKGVRAARLKSFHVGADSPLQMPPPAAKKKRRKAAKKSVRKVSVRRAAPKKTKARRRVKSTATGGKTMAKRRKSRKVGMAGVMFARSKSQSKYKGGKGKRALPVVYKGERFNAPTRKRRINIVKRSNPSYSIQGGRTIKLGSMWDSGHTGMEVASIIGAGILVPFLTAAIARVPLLNKIQAVPTYGVPGSIIIVSGFVNALSKNPTIKSVAKIIATVGMIRLGGSLADMVTAKYGGVKGLMGEVFGDDVGEYEGDDVGEEALAELPQGYHGIDFTPAGQVRPFGEDGVGHGGSMGGIDFTPRSQVRPFGSLPQGLHGADGRDGANFGAMPGRDGANFGEEFGEYAGAMG